MLSVNVIVIRYFRVALSGPTPAAASRPSLPSWWSRTTSSSTWPRSSVWPSSSWGRPSESSIKGNAKRLKSRAVRSSASILLDFHSSSYPLGPPWCPQWPSTTFHRSIVRTHTYTKFKVFSCVIICSHGGERRHHVARTRRPGRRRGQVGRV